MEPSSTIRLLKFECTTGISGDMIVAALHDLLAEAGIPSDTLLDLVQIIPANVPSVASISAGFSRVQKTGFDADHLDLVIDEARDEARSDPQSVLDNLASCISASGMFTAASEAFATSVLEMLIDAEMVVHGSGTGHRHTLGDDHGLHHDAETGDGEQVHHGTHLHELASADTLVDVLCTAKALDLLGFFEGGEGMMGAVSTPVAVGGGTVATAHGRVPVPAPVTAEILHGQQLAYVEGPVDEELATPTGVALLASMRPSFAHVAVPVRIAALGKGAGTKSFQGVANILRVQLLEPAQDCKTPLGEAIDKFASESPLAIGQDSVVQVVLMVDDATPEDVASLVDRTLSNGARDAYVTTVHGKKGRVGMEVTVLCDAQALPRVLDLWLGQGTTIGCRLQQVDRVVLERVQETESITIEAGGQEFTGSVRIKRIECKQGLPPATSRPMVKIEHDDLERVANALGTSIHEARTLVERAINDLQK
jgi:hypothetical protein